MTKNVGDRRFRTIVSTFIFGILVVSAVVVLAKNDSAVASSGDENGSSSEAVDASEIAEPTKKDVGDEIETGKSDSFSFDDAANWARLDDASETTQSFRVDNVVRFVENEREIALKTSTVFCGDLAFDFIGDNGEIIVYSFSARTFALIDPIRRLRTEISVDEIDRFLENVEPRLKAREDGFCNFMLAPRFDVSRKENEWLFQSKWIDYRASTRMFEEKNLSDAYYRFIDDLCKLNIFMNPGTITPFARRAVNRRLQEESRFPEKIVVDVYPKGKMFFNKAIQVVNEHKIAFRTSEKDRNRTMRAVHFVAQFPEVNFRSYYSKINEN